MRHSIYLIFVLMGIVFPAVAQDHDPAKKIIVDASGNGDFRSVTAALNSLPDQASGTTDGYGGEPRVIFIRNGVYNEKIFIEKNNVVLEGEDMGHTILRWSCARDVWRCDHPDDWGVAAGLFYFKDCVMEGGVDFY